MSIQELFDFMSRELQGCSGYAFIDRVLADLRKAMENREDFVPEKFKKWFIEKSVIYKNSPLAFLAKCGVEDIEKGVFDKAIIKSFDLLPLCEDMRALGIEYSPKDTLLLDRYLTYIHNNDMMSINELGAWLHTAVQIIAKHTKNATEFKDLFRKSQSMKKLNLPYEDIENSVDKDFNEIEDMINDIESEKK